MRPSLPHLFVLKRYCGWVAAAIALLRSVFCTPGKTGAPYVPLAVFCTPGKTGAPYVPLAELEAVYGPLITAGNHPTSDQSNGGGFFDADF